MKVLVTGGAGFIGSHVVDALIAAGHAVRVLDLAPPQRDPGEVEHCRADLLDLGAVSEAAAGCDAIVHLAAVADVNDVVADPVRAERVNAAGTLNVLEAARRERAGRVVYGSTIWVYSDCEPGAVDEDTPLAPPRHLYSATKLAGELYCRSYAELYGVEYTILRFGIPYGPRAREATVIPAFVRRAEAGEPLEIAGDGQQSRRFVYVEDLAQGVVAALRPEAANRVYNLAGEETTTVLEIAEAVRRNVRDTGIARTAARGGDFAGKEVSSERALSELGWRPATRFADGIRAYLEWRRGQRARPRVLILTADIGAGHDLPARMLAAEVRAEAPGADVRIADGLRAMGRLMTAVVRDGSWVAFNWLPWLFELQYFLLTRLPPTRWLALRLSYLVGARRLERLVRAHDPDVVISTYPGTTAVLGELRLRGRLERPVVSVITDLAGLRFWAHPGVDLHTVTHPESIAEVERIAGPGSVRAARPPTAPELLRPRSRAEARRSLGLPAEGTIVLVSGGGWGIGDLEGAVRVALGAADAVVCLTGRNERAMRALERRYGGDPRVRVLGFTDRMSDLLAAADAAVHSTAGLTVLEAQIRGCPVVSFGFACGHVRVNNRAYRRFGLARVATTRRGLARELRAAIAAGREPDPSFARLPSAASLALAARARERARVPRRLIPRAGLAAAAAIALAAWTMLTDDMYPLVAHAFGVAAVREVQTTRPEVGLIVDTSPAAARPLARRLGREGIQASLAMRGLPSPATLRALAAWADVPMPWLDGGGPLHSLGTRGRLAAQARALGLGPRFAYRPDEGMSVSQYLLARAAGGVATRGAVELGPGSAPPRLQPGEIVELDRGTGNALAALRRGLERSGLRAVAASSLVVPAS